MMHAGAMGAAKLRTSWRWFPLAICGALLVVVAVNFGMAYVALHSFPGLVAQNVYGHSNDYDRELEAAHAQPDWRVEAAAVDGAVVVSLFDRDQQPVDGVQLRAVARRPVGPEEATPLDFRAIGPGRYRAVSALPGTGQWSLAVAARGEAGLLRVTRRVVAR